MQKLLVLLFFSLCLGKANAQIEAGLFGGIANYQGDLVDKAYKNSKTVFGVTVAYPVTNRISIRAGVNFAKLVGADSLLDQEDLRLRNLSFQTSLTEFSLVGEFNTFDLEVKRWSPYVFGGIAVYHFNPYTMDLDGNKVNLKPLSTEGQGLPGYGEEYSLTQLALPFGGGIKYNLTSQVRLALEVGLRKLFTDYLDDVSGDYASSADLLAGRGAQSLDLSYRGDELANGNPDYPAKGITRGSPKYKDFYYFTGLHLSFRLGYGENGGGNYGPGKKKGYGCPTVF